VRETKELLIRPAKESDREAILFLIDSLAAFEKLPPPDETARERLMQDAFGPRPRYEILLAESNATVIAYAFFFETYSSFLALPSLYLEDLFVLEAYRGKGAGKALLRAVVAEAKNRACGRVEFMVLDWNKRARQFYETLGAVHLHDWCAYRITQSSFDQVLDAIE
jgi:GNAT superfamily N-acetyltransferase